jgi:hypothetical protein
MEVKAATNASGAKESLGLQMTRRSQWASTTKILSIPLVNIEKCV